MESPTRRVRETITVAVGRAAEIDALKNDWVMTQEMIHLAFPMAENHHWIEEGISTYVEPVAPERKWARFQCRRCGSDSFLTCHKESPPPAIEVSQHADLGTNILGRSNVLSDR